MPKTDSVIAKIEADILEAIEVKEQPENVQAMFAARAYLLGVAPSEPKPRKPRKKRGLPAEDATI